MTGVDRLQQILAQIRSTLASKTGRAQQSRNTGISTIPGTPAVRTLRPTVEELKAQISNGLAASDLATANGRRQARRVFLESVLLAEFGVNLANDPRFSGIVAGVQDTFEQEPSLLTNLDTVLEELQNA